jgi:hypothetical protein
MVRAARPPKPTAATTKAATTTAAVVSTLILRRASASRPSGRWREDDYDVLEGGVVVGGCTTVALRGCAQSYRSND